MNKVPVLVILLLLNSVLWAQEKEIKCQIDQVTVFQQSAQLQMSGKTQVAAGKTLLSLKSLSPYLDPQSISVKGAGEITILSVNHAMNYLGKIQKDKRIDSIKLAIEGLESGIVVENNKLEVLKEKQSLLNANKRLTAESGTLSLTQLKQALDFYEQELNEIKNRERAANTKIKELTEKKQKLDYQLADLNNQSDLPTSEVEIMVSAERPGTAAFQVSFMVGNAGWKPKYDVRAKDITSPLSLQYKALVHQNTGQDWNNVKLILSNANPNQSGVAPQMNPWYVSIYTNPRVSYMLQGKAQGVNMNDYAKKEMPAAAVYDQAEALAEASVVTTTVVDNATSISFQVDIPYTVSSNGEELLIDVVQYEVPANYTYYAVPKLDKDAFLIAEIQDWGKYNLSDGEVNLYFEDAYVGKTWLNVRAFSDTLRLSLGRDKGIAISRKKSEQYAKRRSLGSNTIESKGFDFQIRNTKRQKIHIKLYDQLPLAASSEIEVTAKDLAKGKLDPATGEILWEFDLEPQAQNNFTLLYEVKYPKKERVILE